MSIHAPSNNNFQSLLRISRSSIANPSWFATPVDAHEDESALVVSFHVPEHSSVRVQANDQSITLWGSLKAPNAPSKAMRICALPCAIVSSGIESVRSGDVLRVRIPKKRPAEKSTETSESVVTM